MDETAIVGWVIGGAFSFASVWLAAWLERRHADRRKKVEELIKGSVTHIRSRTKLIAEEFDSTWLPIVTQAETQKGPLPTFGRIHYYDCPDVFYEPLASDEHCSMSARRPFGQGYQNGI